MPMPVQWKNSRILAVTALIIVTAVWGSTFVLVKNAISLVPVMDFLWIRFLVAALAMIILRPLCLRKFTWRGVLRGIISGLFLSSAYIAQTFGLQTASATVSGFLTGMSVVLTPVIAWIVLRQKPNGFVWISVVTATIGLGFLALRGWSIGTGELLTLLCALLFACHIITLAKWAPAHNAYGLAFIQIITVAIVSFIASVPQGITIPVDTSVWIAIGITALLATAFAFIIQTWVQSILPPFHTAIILTMEPVFAGIFGISFGGDPFTWQTATGAALILGAMILVQLTLKKDTPPVMAGASDTSSSTGRQ